MTSRLSQPTVRPARACFSSGPCAKPPGWSFDKLHGAFVGRSHRTPASQARLREVIERSRTLLALPADWRLGIVPASDTGAMEMALWSLLGSRGVDILAWESFGETWVTDIVEQLCLRDVRIFRANYGKLPDLSQVDPGRDIVFTWNGTTAGVKVPHGNWIANNRHGLAVCDATSAVFAMEIPWDRLDVVTWSWQKALGGEAAHGMLALSPRAVARLESYTPPWPLPKVFRLTRKGQLIDGIFNGETINTPSMIAVEDQISVLKWAESVGGLKGLISRSMANFKVIESWVATSSWVSFLAEVPDTRSNTSICLKIVAPWFKALAPAEKIVAAKALTTLLEKENVAHDIGAYRDAPPGLRIWGGATVEKDDIAALCTWLDWAAIKVARSTEQS